MPYCLMHDYFFQGKSCPKCFKNEKPHMRFLDEIADPEERRLIKKRGWGI